MKTLPLSGKNIKQNVGVSRTECVLVLWHRFLGWRASILPASPKPV